MTDPTQQLQQIAADFKLDEVYKNISKDACGPVGVQQLAWAAIIHSDETRSAVKDLIIPAIRYPNSSQDYVHTLSQALRHEALHDSIADILPEYFEKSVVPDQYQHSDFITFAIAAHEHERFMPLVIEHLPKGLSREVDDNFITNYAMLINGCTDQNTDWSQIEPSFTQIMQQHMGKEVEFTDPKVIEMFETIRENGTPVMKALASQYYGATTNLDQRTNACCSINFSEDSDPYPTIFIKELREHFFYTPSYISLTDLQTIAHDQNSCEKIINNAITAALQNVIENGSELQQENIQHIIEHISTPPTQKQRQNLNLI